MMALQKGQSSGTRSTLGLMKSLNVIKSLIPVSQSLDPTNLKPRAGVGGVVVNVT
jgi:hypothetical protein